LFVALLPPPEALNEVAAAIRPFHQEWSRLRWVDPALWHVTLAFLGEVPDRALPDLGVRLSRAAARHAPMSLWFRGAGAFPSPGRARLLWVGLGVDPEGTPSGDEAARKAEMKNEPRSGAPSGRERLKRLAESVAAGARRAGAKETDRKPFHPHLTVARTRQPDNLRELVDVTCAFEGRIWKAEAVHLVQSHLGAKVRYESVAAYPLGRRD
jgi:2'-5' RNA ligase